MSQVMTEDLGEGSVSRNLAPASLTSPAPSLSAEDAEDCILQLWGLEGRAENLVAERDQNFRFACTDGESYFLKITNSGEDRAVSNLQTETLLHLARRAPTLPVPRLMVSKEGRVEEIWVLGDGREALVRLMTAVPGEPLFGKSVSPQLAIQIGRNLGLLDLAMFSFSHPVRKHDLLWDLKNISDLKGMVSFLDDADRSMVLDALDHFESSTNQALKALPSQYIHNDFCLNNLFECEEQISGIIDFGDMVNAPRVIDPTIAACYLINPKAERPFQNARAMLAAYQATAPLDEQEKILLPDLIAARNAMTLLITSWRAQLHPENAKYIQRNAVNARLSLRAFQERGSVAELDQLWGDFDA